MHLTDRILSVAQCVHGKPCSVCTVSAYPVFCVNGQCSQWPHGKCSVCTVSAPDRMLAQYVHGKPAVKAWVRHVEIHIASDVMCLLLELLYNIFGNKYGVLKQGKSSCLGIP